jgi:hypothetical protein
LLTRNWWIPSTQVSQPASFFPEQLVPKEGTISSHNKPLQFLNEATNRRRQYQIIGHSENVDEYGDIWRCTILVQAYDNQQQKGTTEDKHNGRMAV